MHHPLHTLVGDNRCVWAFAKHSNRTVYFKYLQGAFCFTRACLQNLKQLFQTFIILIHCILTDWNAVTRLRLAYKLFDNWKLCCIYSLSYVNVSNNQLKTPEPEWFRSVYKRKDPQLLGGNLVKGNPWLCCDCGVVPLLGKWTGKMTVFWSFSSFIFCDAIVDSFDQHFFKSF